MKRSLITVAAVIVAASALGACSSVGGAQERQFASEKQACAQLGLDPASPAFHQCAINLDATMFGIDTNAR